MIVTLKFGKPGFIAHPYWPEMHRLVEIVKHSGLSRCRTEKSRRAALEQELRTRNMTLEEYQALEIKANVPFFFNAAGYIYIPADRIHSCLTNASKVAPSKIRIDDVRVVLKVSDFETNKQKPDHIWERMVQPKDGSGKPLSNQRGLRSNPVIEDFEAVGTCDFDPEMVEPKAVKTLWEFAGRVVGIGASRGMGYGRFTATFED